MGLFNIFKKKASREEVSVNIFGTTHVIDVSEVAMSKRAVDYDHMVAGSWIEIKELDFERDEVQYFKAQWTNHYESKVIGFHGKMIFSDDKQYCVIFVDAINDNEKGKVCLYNVTAKNIDFLIEVNRPHKCVVSDSGIVACSDWISRTSRSNSFHVYNSAGSTLISVSLKENVGDVCMISKDGLYAVYDTCSSNRIHIVDIKNCMAIGSILKDTPRCKIDLENRRITMHYENETKIHQITTSL